MTSLRHTQALITAFVVTLIGNGCSSWSPNLVSLHGNATSIASPTWTDSGYLPAAKAKLWQGHLLQLLGRAECVDRYYHAAQLAWYAASDGNGEPFTESSEATGVYRNALLGLINQAQHHRRWIRGHGIEVHCQDGRIVLPLTFMEPNWQTNPFDHLMVVDESSAKRLNNYYRCCGVGVTAVGQRHRNDPDDDRFAPTNRFASATILMRPTDKSSSFSPRPMLIEVYDPLRTKSVEIAGRRLPLAIDYSAPIKTAMGSHTTADALNAFLQPGLTSPDESGLFLLEHYQPGKIPVIVVHGLLSDRFTWANFINEVRVHPDLVDRFQFWSYQYPTGEPFLQSAARLRRDLTEFRQRFDPTGADIALDQTILVGHSMGGLIAKLQTVSSGDALWRSISSRPMDQLALRADTRATLTDIFFFEPSQMVSRVVFIGTPHRGSAFAQRAAGRLGSLLVRESEDLRRRHRETVDANPDTFSDEFSRRIPTSIDLLNPSSQLLQAISCLEIDPQIVSHSIIGNWRPMIGNGPSDGVVPVHSASITGVETQRILHQRHTGLTNDATVINDLIRIMREHAALL